MKVSFRLAPGFRTQLHVTTSLSTGGGPVSDDIQLSEGVYRWFIPLACGPCPPELSIRIWLVNFLHLHSHLHIHTASPLEHQPRRHWQGSLGDSGLFPAPMHLSCGPPEADARERCTKHTDYNRDAARRRHQIKLRPQLCGTGGLRVAEAVPVCMS